MSRQKKPSPDPAEQVLRASRTVIIGHRGYRAIAPENTIPSFELALAAGVDLVEFDYRNSSDGTPVVIHDAKVGRTTNAKRTDLGDANVNALTLAQLRTLDAGAWKDPRFAGVRIPTLGQAIDAIRPGAMPLIERKNGDAESLARFLRRRNLVNEVIVIAFDWNFLKELRELLPEQVLGALGPAQGKLKRLKALARPSLNEVAVELIAGIGCNLVVWNNRVNKTAVAAAHARGMPVWIYTVNDSREAQRLVRAGVGGLITDDPPRIRRALALRH